MRSGAHLGANRAAGIIANALGAQASTGAEPCALTCGAGVAGAAGASSQQAASMGAHSGPGAETSCSGQHGAHCGPAIARALGSAQSTAASASTEAIRVFIGMER